MIRARNELSNGAAVWICCRVAQAADVHGDCRRQAQMTWLQGGVESEAPVGSVRRERNQGIEFGVRQPRAAQVPVTGVVEDAVAPATDDPADRHWHAMEVEAVASELGTSCAEGLPRARAKDRLAQSGSNSIPPLHQRSELSIFLSQFQSLPVALLACVAVVSLATGTLLEAGAIAGDTMRP